MKPSHDVPRQYYKLAELVQKPERRNPELFPEKTFNYVEIGSINTDDKTIESYSQILGKEASPRARNVIRNNDVIYATTRPYYRNVAIVPQTLDGEICTTGFCVLRVKDSRVLSPRYLFYYMQSDQANTQILKSLRGKDRLWESNYRMQAAFS